MSFTGLLQVGIELGLDAITVKPKRQIGTFTAQVTILEEHIDELEITEQPVEQGAAITDHAFKRPARLIIEAAWSNTPSANAVGGASSLLGSLAGAVTGTIGGVVDLASQAGAAFNGVKDTVGQLSDVVTNPLTAAGKFVSSGVNQVTDGIITTVAGGVQNVFGDVSGSVGNIVSGVTGNIGGGIGDAVSSLADGIGDFSGSLDGLTSSTTGNNVGQVKDTYAKFLDLQESRIPFDVFTGKRVYTNMLIKSMRTKSDKETENTLPLRIEMQQIIIVSTAQSISVSSNQDSQEDPEETAPTEDEGDKQMSEADSYSEESGDASIDADPPAEESGS